VYTLPYRVWDVVGPRGRGVCGLGESPGDLFGGEGGVVIILREAKTQGRWGFGGKEVVQERFRYLSRVGGHW